MGTGDGRTYKNPAEPSRNREIGPNRAKERANRGGATVQAARARTDASARWPDATTNGWRVGATEMDDRQSSSRSQPSAVRTQGGAGKAGGRPAVDPTQREESEPIVRMTSAMAKIERISVGAGREQCGGPAVEKE